jgi:restriction system protein
MSKEPEWYSFQEEIAKYFRSLGTNAETNKAVQGVRTKHDIDVFVSTKFLSTDLHWIIEAKKWKSKVSKEKVLALRSIVDDLGADKGFIISEVGFQKGAYEAANNTNILLYTIEQFKEKTKHLVHTEILNMYIDRARLLDIRYWSHKKQIRKDYNLRPDIFDSEIYFSGTELLSLIFKAISKGIKSQYPINLLIYSKRKIGNEKADNFDELINWLNLNLNMLDRVLLKAEYSMLKNNDFNPNTMRSKYIEFHGVTQFASTSEILADPSKLELLINQN